MNINSKITASASAIWTSRVLTGLVILPFAMSAVMKLMQSPAVVEGFARMHISSNAMVPLGIVELTCLAAYLIPRTTVLGTLLLTGYLGGAVLANLINGSDFIHAFVIGFLVWAGAWLRVPELRVLIPIRRTTHGPSAVAAPLRFRAVMPAKDAAA